ncbi:uncharacterized protein LOC103250443 [Carlito syrichta]|uniref:Uncharacterized protein LOC103250443 n=1 Tax=Carlito syrichta TaxID=1868482 RepID=A0A1U7T2R9_CARSF|nr:uncharacterized protein LOC103250443 [Carlito syrichta]
MPPNLTGYYRFVSQKNIEDYLQALNISTALRRVARWLKPDKEIDHQGDHLTVKTLSAFRTYVLEFQVGVEFEEDLRIVDGRKCQVLVLGWGRRRGHPRVTPSSLERSSVAAPSQRQGLGRHSRPRRPMIPVSGTRGPGAATPHTLSSLSPALLITSSKDKEQATPPMGKHSLPLRLVTLLEPSLLSLVSVTPLSRAFSCFFCVPSGPSVKSLVPPGVPQTGASAPEFCARPSLPCLFTFHGLSGLPPRLLLRSVHARGV